MRSASGLLDSDDLEKRRERDGVVKREGTVGLIPRVRPGKRMSAYRSHATYVCHHANKRTLCFQIQPHYLSGTLRKKIRKSDRG